MYRYINNKQLKLFIKLQHEYTVTGSSTILNTCVFNLSSTILMCIVKLVKITKCFIFRNILS